VKIKCLDLDNILEDRLSLILQSEITKNTKFEEETEQKLTIDQKSSPKLTLRLKGGCVLTQLVVGRTLKTLILALSADYLL